MIQFLADYWVYVSLFVYLAGIFGMLIYDGLTHTWRERTTYQDNDNMFPLMAWPIVAVVIIAMSPFMAAWWLISKFANPFKMGQYVGRKYQAFQVDREQKKQRLEQMKAEIAIRLEKEITYEQAT